MSPSFPQSSLCAKKAENSSSALVNAHPAFLRACNVATWSWNLNTGGILYSIEWRDLLELPPEQEMGEDLHVLYERVHADDLPLLQKAAEALMDRTASTLDLTVRARRFDFTWAWVLLRGGCLPQAHPNEDLLFQGIVFEVSRLRLDSRFWSGTGDPVLSYQSILENSPDLIARYDRELFPLYINKAIRQYIPFSPAELGDKRRKDFDLDERHLDFLQRHVHNVFTTGEAVQARATFSTSMTGAYTGDYSFWPEFGIDGKVKAVLSQMRNVTGQLRTEHQLRMNEMRSAALYKLTQMHDASEEEIIRYIVEQSRILTESEHSCLHLVQIEGQSNNTVVWSESHNTIIPLRLLASPHTPFADLGVSDELLNQRDACAYNTSDSEPVHMAFGGLLPLYRYMRMPVFDGDKLICLVSVANKQTDYTLSDQQGFALFITGAWLVLHRKRYVNSLQRSKEVAEQANRVKDEFIAKISHEVRTPLNGILSMLQLLELSPLSEEQHEYLRTANLSGKALLRIISDILDFSSMESGKLHLHNAPFNVKTTLRTTVALFEHEAAQKQIELKFSVEDGIPELIVGDEARLRQIILNLVGNSLKFTEKGHIQVECSILSHRHKGCLWLYFCINDTGIGIPEAALEHIFDAFAQVDTSSTRKNSGTGLGLSIVRQLITHMGGNISLDSEVGKGTIMHCVLPFSLAEDTRPLAFMQIPTVTAASVKRLDILVAEDDPVGQFAIKAFLSRFGHKVLCVQNGRQALEALQLYPFHCFISDIQMPEMDGLEATRRIRSAEWADIPPSDEIKDVVHAGLGIVSSQPIFVPVDLPIVAVSAHAKVKDQQLFLQKGMDLYLSKPIALEDLAKVLDTLIEWQSEREAN